MKVSKWISVLCSVVMLCCTACHERARDFDACGQIEATEVVVSAESNGKIIRMDVEEGDQLPKGTCVGNIDSVQTYLQKKELEGRKVNAESRIVDIQQQLASQYDRLSNLKKDRERFKALLAKDAGTQKQVDDIESQIAVTESEIAAQRQTYEKNNAGVRDEMAVYDVQIAQRADQLAKCRIVAPINGTVLTKYAEAGEMVTTGKPLFKMADMERVYVRAYLTTAQLADVKVGDAVRVVVEDGSTQPRSYDGTITWISDEAEFTPKNIQTKDERADLVYATKVTVDNDGYLKLGMYAYIHLD